MLKIEKYQLFVLISHEETKSQQGHAACPHSPRSLLLRLPLSKLSQTQTLAAQ